MFSPVQILIAVINSLLVFFILLVPADTQGTVASCVPEIKVRKNTVYTDFREEPFQLSCPVTYCEKTPDVQWIKIDDKSKFIQINETNIMTITQEHKGSKDLISNLTFKRISTDDNGVYRCKISTPTFKLESHNININITDFSDHITTNTPTPARTRSGDNWVLYFLICTGILGLVLTVLLISYLSINGCSRRMRNRRHRKAAFIPRPVSTTMSRKFQDVQEEQTNVYNAPIDNLHSESDALCTANNQEGMPDMRNVNRSSVGSQHIVYATLQHPTTREPSAARYQSREQLSEYASIRIS